MSRAAGESKETTWKAGASEKSVMKATIFIIPPHLGQVIGSGTGGRSGRDLPAVGPELLPDRGMSRDRPEARQEQAERFFHIHPSPCDGRRFSDAEPRPLIAKTGYRRSGSRVTYVSERVQLAQSIGLIKRRCLNPP